MLVLISYTVHEQDTVVARHKSTNYMCYCSHVIYTTRNAICAYIALVLPVSIPWNFLNTATNTHWQMSSLD